MKIRCLIVDDEELARERVRSLLADEEDIQIAGEAADGHAAVAAIEEYQPDLVFLDIQMPGLTGFDVIEAIPEGKLPTVIFTTAYDTHAVRAFEISALDYLLKPFKPARFRESLERARAKISGNSPVPAEPALGTLMAHLRAIDGGPRILVKSPEKILFVRAAEIDHVEAAGNYLVLHCGGERHIVRETMAAMVKRLEPSGFMRISRSSIVNLSRIRELQPISSGHYTVILKTGAKLDMTSPLRDLQERMSG
ncbi:LytR/AlgR family response regulator transcription factor [Luteolibacter luteus]|uniref:Response regulator n=1 Tax=Luteolibacter luteus TaxID=2728835 RepID=A0A858RL16_9BACT|nr:response regulator [Luteolibacter luteus]QJE97435.1 response regulator [Luteolibacter luteus]